MEGIYLLYVLNCLLVASGGIFLKQFDKKTANVRNSSNAFNLTMSVISMLVFFITGLFESGGFSFDATTVKYAVFYALGFVLGMTGQVLSIRYGPLLISIIISRMGALIPMFYSIFAYGDEFSIFMILGTITLFVALALFNMQTKQPEQAQPRKKIPFRFWIFALMSGTGNGIVMLATKIHQIEMADTHKSDLLFLGMLIVSAVFLILVLVQPPKQEQATLKEGEKQPNVLQLFFLGVMWTVFYAVSNALVNFISASIVNKLPAVFFFMASTGFNVLFTFLIARFLYREKLNVFQYVGCIAATAGLILLNF